MHQINAPKFLLLSLKSSVAEKKHVAMQKLFIKKEEKKKWTSVCDIESNGYSDARLKKEKERRIR